MLIETARRSLVHTNTMVNGQLVADPLHVTCDFHDKQTAVSVHVYTDMDAKGVPSQLTVDPGNDLTNPSFENERVVENKRTKGKNKNKNKNK